MDTDLNLSPRRLYWAVAACAIVVYLGALWNRFAMDDRFIIVLNPLLRSPSGVWRAFLEPYWPGDLGGKLYRPLTVATYVIDRMIDGWSWFHAANLLWHAGVSVAVTVLVRRWVNTSAALIAGVLFAVHPVHVEAVANVVGRNELMAALFVLLAVYAALERQSVVWCSAALAGGLLSKENAAVAPGLIVWAWCLGLSRPTRARAVSFLVSWIVLGAAYALLYSAVLRPYERMLDLAPVFVGEGPVAIRLTAVAALADVTRLLVFPLTLRADYSPAERTIVTSVLDGRFVIGLLCVLGWAGLLLATWRRGRRIEALGLGWIGIAFLPVANLLFPIGALLGERLLYLPSVGLVLAVGAWLRNLPGRRVWTVAAVIFVAGGLRTALRVPVWRDDRTVALSMLTDSPDSYFGPWGVGAMLQGARQPDKALAAYQQAISKYDRSPMLLVAAADAALTLGRPALADSLLERAERVCFRCFGNYRIQAAAARVRGDTAVADSLLARMRRLGGP